MLLVSIMTAEVEEMLINFGDLMNVVLLLWLVCALISVATIIWNYERFNEMVDECLEDSRYLMFASKDVWLVFSVLVVMVTSPYLIGYWGFHRIKAWLIPKSWCYSIATSDVDDIEFVILVEGQTIEDVFQNYVITTNAEVDIEVN